MTSIIELWFDFSCPYAYLASVRAASLGITIDWRPMLLGGVFRGIGAGEGPMATLSVAKAAHNHRDMYRWAELFDVPFQLPPAHPQRTVRALRMLLALPHASWPVAIEAFFAAYWQRGEDVTQDAVLAAALRGCGLADDVIVEALAGADTDAIKDDLRRRTDEAIALGIFGAPAWIWRRDGKDPLLVWGQDRFAWLEAIIRGWDPDATAPPGGPRPFVMPAATTPAQGQTLDVYFDVSSPFAYLALTQLPALARPGLTPRLIPILLGGLFKDLGTPNVPLLAFPAPKLRHIGLEMTRWGRWLGEPIQMPSKFPQRTISAQRLCVLALEHGGDVALRLATALARAMWAENRDLEDPATLHAILDATGLPSSLIERCSEPAVKQSLIDNTNAARAAGVFGVPTFVVDNFLVWGQDRLELVAKLLDGWKPARG